MKGWQDRLERASLGAVFGWTTLVFFVVRSAVDALTGSDVLDPLLLILRLASSALFGGLMVLIIGRQRRRSGGTSVSADVTAAQKTGRVPLSADPAAWIPALEWRRAQFRRSRWLSPVLLGVLMLMGVAIVAIDPTSYAGWLVIAVFLGLGIMTAVQTRRALPRIEEMLRELRARPGASSPEVVPPGTTRSTGV